MAVNESKTKRRVVFYTLLLFLIGNVVLKVIYPSVAVHYSEGGVEELRYIWNVQDRIYKGGMQPGGGTFDTGFLFPGEDYFMEFYWWGEGARRNHCVSIVPGWFGVDIKLDANGDIDMREGSGTSISRLQKCKWDSAEM